MAERVLVTGGSGYLAGSCIARLLQDGYSVRTTVRSPRRARDLQQLDVVVADLTSDAGWATAVRDCDYVLHVAAPLPIAKPRHDDELVVPARDGALRVLNAARDGGVRRVVMTSSTAAISCGHGSRQAPFTEADWTDETNRADTSAYKRAKTIAERAAWAWLVREGGSLELVTVCPSVILGPVSGGDFAASLEVVKRLLDGSMPALPRLGYPIVDVRDVADLHLRAMIAPHAAGQRYLGGGDWYWTHEIAALLRARVPELTSRMPKRTAPDWLVRLRAWVDPVARDRLFDLGKYRPVSSARAKQELGWSPRPNDMTIVETARSLRAHQII
jgi:dihydroflavonol-4-reductase